MLFNSYEFIFFFLPVTLCLFLLAGSFGLQRVAVSWLVLASLFFYSWWNPAYLMLIIFSIMVNYSIGIVLSRQDFVYRKAMLVVGVTANLAALGYFKYANFFVININALLDTDIFLETIILPLAISFFTFQQIAYLVDAYRLETKEYNFLHYCLFVTFFPQLIAGPIVHHKEMLPQFARDSIYRFNAHHLSVGLTIFSIGLFKKLIIADGMAEYATPVFSLAAEGAPITFFDAWLGALAYTFQLYFDFSGYSDMAIGLARMFGIRLPLNFHSPYKAVSIIDFWRRWHMTLSRFLRDYLYFSLGGNKKGPVRRYTNLLVTMVLGGIWHGAGWTFVFWGLLHGVYLIINHFWRELKKITGLDVHDKKYWNIWFSRCLTFLVVLIGWVFFRAESLPSALYMLETMFGFNGISLPLNIAEKSVVLRDLLVLLGFHFDNAVNRTIFSSLSVDMMWFAILLIICWFAPNTQQIMSRYSPALDVYHWQTGAEKNWWQWRPTFAWAVFSGSVVTISVLGLTRISEFLYFQF